MALALLYFLSEFNAGTVRIIEINIYRIEYKIFSHDRFPSIRRNKLYGRDN